MARTSHFPLQHPVFGSLVFPQLSLATLAPAAAATLTTDQVLGGLIQRDCNGASRTDTLPTAAALVDAISGCLVGTSFKLHIRNTADAAETITVAIGAGGTISGTATIAQNSAKFRSRARTLIRQGSEAYVVYSMGSVTF